MSFIKALSYTFKDNFCTYPIDWYKCQSIGQYKFYQELVKQFLNQMVRL